MSSNRHSRGVSREGYEYLRTDSQFHTIPQVLEPLSSSHVTNPFPLAQAPQGLGQPKRLHVQDTSDLPLILTAAEVASVLRVGRSSMYSLLKQGVVPSIRLGKSIRVLRDQLLDWLEAGGLDEVKDNDITSSTIAPKR